MRYASYDILATDQREVREVLQGHITAEHGKPVFKYIRIFLSSNLTGAIRPVTTCAILPC